MGTTDKGTVFGGYNPRGWLGYGEWRDAISAFLFVFDGAGKPTKLPKLGGSGMAIIGKRDAFSGSYYYYFFFFGGGGVKKSEERKQMAFPLS